MSTFNLEFRQRLFDDWYYKNLERYKNTILLEQHLKSGITITDIKKDVMRNVAVRKNEYVNVRESLNKHPNDTMPHLVVEILRKRTR